MTYDADNTRVSDMETKNNGLGAGNGTSDYGVSSGKKAVCGVVESGTTEEPDAISKAILHSLSVDEAAKTQGHSNSNGKGRALDVPAYRLTASEALGLIRSGDLTVEEYARSLLGRIAKRDPEVRAWAYLDPEYVLAEARRLDAVPIRERGPLHGLPVGVKDVIYTKDMPTEHHSPIYKDSSPNVDAASIIMLRHAGALLLGKTVTTEFAATSTGRPTCNPHNLNHTPGGSSSGSGAAVADFQAPVALGTQTGGSMIRPASFNGVYALKPTWNSVSREGQKIFSVVLDTLGIFARSADDLQLMADVFAIEDDEEDDGHAVFEGIRGARFAICKTMSWESAGPATCDALAHAAALLRARGAIVEEIELPAEFDPLPGWHNTLLHTEGRTSFLPEYRIGKDKMDSLLVGYVEKKAKYTNRHHLEALDGVAALRPKVDSIARKYAAIVAPSVEGEAPLGNGFTGNATFCSPWSTLHTPVINIPGFKGPSGMPVGISLIAPRYRDSHLLKVAKAVGPIFGAEGGWKSEL